jgi:hypothetical protein
MTSMMVIGLGVGLLLPQNEVGFLVVASGAVMYHLFKIT